MRVRGHPARETARRVGCDDIEVVCNPKSKHTSDGMPSPVAFEARPQKLNAALVWAPRAPHLDRGRS